MRSVTLGVLAGLLAFPGVAQAQRRCRISTVEILPAEAQVRPGQQVTFIANAYDNAGAPCESVVNFSWASSNPAVATINTQTGIAVGVAPGSSIIRATTGTGAARRQATVIVTVLPSVPVNGESVRTTGPATRQTELLAGPTVFDLQPEGSGPPEALVISPPRLLMVRGEHRQLGYRAVRADGQNAQKVPIVFSVEPGGESIVSVDSVGRIISLHQTGSARVRASVPGIARVPPSVVNVEVRSDSVQFERRETSLSPGVTETLAVVVPQQDGRPIERSDLQFSSSNPSVVRVNPARPIVEAVAPGTARITGISASHEISLSVSVHRRVASLETAVSDSVVTIAIGQTLRLGVRALADDGTPVPEAPLRWQPPDGGALRLDTAAGTVNGARIGEGRVAVRVPSGRDSAITRAWRFRVVAGGLQLTQSRFALGVGERAALGVTLLDDRRQPIPGAAVEVTWSSSSDSVGRYEGGQVLGRALGRARLTARAPWDSSATAEVFVVGDVIVSAQRGGVWDLLMLRPGQETLALTRDSSIETHAAWSPDLTRIAFTAAPASRPRNTDLYLADADGSGATRLTSDSATVASPAFHPAGDRIVYESNRGGRPHIYLVGLDGSGSRRLTSGDNPNTAPSVSPDGERVLFTSVRETSPGLRNSDIYEMGLDGSGERRLTTSPRIEDSPAYAPDGQSFFYLRDEGGSPASKRVYRQDFATGNPVPLTPQGVYVQSFSVGGDGATLALTILEAGPGGTQLSRVALFNIASGAMTNLTTRSGDRFASAVLKPARRQSSR